MHSHFPFLSGQRSNRSDSRRQYTRDWRLRSSSPSAPLSGSDRIAKRKRTNYERGKETEKRIRGLLEDDGYYVVESRGSHGAVDIVAIGHGRLVLIQSKRTEAERVTPSMYRDDLEKLRDLREKHELPPNTSLELWVWRDRRGFEKQVV